MTITSDPVRQFDAAVAASAAGWLVRPEVPDDAEFLQCLFIANAPLAGVLPPAMLAQQHAMQEASFRATHPDAMRRLLLHDDRPVGRFIADWSGVGPVHGVDIAVLPDVSGRGGGLVMLRAWLAVSDAIGRPSSLFVAADNRARRLYQRLGFVEDALQDANAPIVRMVRPAADRPDNQASS